MSHPTHLASVQRDARALHDSGDLANARLLLEHALEVARSTYGEDHPDVLTTARLLAGLHREAGEPAAARRVLEETLAAGRLRYGDEDRVMLALSFDLGSVAEELGNRHEARRNFGRVVAAGPAVLGPDDWTVRAARDYLSETDPAAGQASAIRTSRTISPMQTGYAVSPARPPEPRPAPLNPAPQPAYPVALPARTAEPEAVPAPGPSPARRKRGATVAIAAASAAVAATLATAVLAARGTRPGTLPAPAATTTAPAPTDPPRQLRLREDGAAITVSWADPTRGTVPFIVMGGRAGEQLRAMGTLNPGDTSYRLDGLNPTLDYCFTVVAVYATDRLAAGEQVCTRRSARPSEAH